MKRLAALILVLCLLLCACGKSAEAPAPTEAPTEAVTEAPTEAPTEPEPTEPEPTEPEPTEPPVIYRHPLTGEVVDQPWTTRPVICTINNYPVATPQYAISQADIFYEIETEGSVTRGLAFFTDLSGVGAIGSTRSARTYLNSICYSYSGVFAHVGASDFARYGAYDMAGNKLPNYEHIDWGFHPSYTYRDQDRLNAGYAWEHCLFTNGENLQQALADLGFDMEVEEGIDYGLTFAEEPEISGEPATNLVVTFPGLKTTTFELNQETGLYEAYQFDGPWIDAGNGDAILSFRNLIVMIADRYRPNGVHSFYEIIGTGEGYFACDGQIVKIQWHRETVDDPYSFTLEDGTPITLGVGHSYYGVITPNGSLTFN